MTNAERRAEFLDIIGMYMKHVKNDTEKQDRVNYMNKILGACLVARFTKIMGESEIELLSDKAIGECYRVREEIAT